MDKIAIWGAGSIGKKAIEEIGIERIGYVIDTNEKKIGSDFFGIPVISFDDFLKKDVKTLLITTLYVDEIYDAIKNIESLEVDVYRPLFDCYGEYDSFIQNNYTKADSIDDEYAWNAKLESILERRYINGYTKILARKKEIKLFDHVEIETINRCNGTCSFCPVSVGNDVRTKAKMSNELFNKIIDELAAMKYSGRLSLFSNNEPFLDERIIDFQKIAREKLPEARLHLFTNGSLLSVEKFIEIMPYLDELVIDNYNQELKLNEPVEKIYKYCLEHEELKNKVTISLRKKEEILTSRGGNAPNRNKTVDVSDYGCLLPFFQLIIRPDGKVSLCCNDALGENTLGDLNHQSLMDVWRGEEHMRIIEAISRGRSSIKQCSNCDAYNLAPRMKRF